MFIWWLLLSAVFVAPVLRWTDTQKFSDVTIGFLHRPSIEPHQGSYSSAAVVLEALIAKHSSGFLKIIKCPIAVASSAFRAWMTSGVEKLCRYQRASEPHDDVSPSTARGIANFRPVVELPDHAANRSIDRQERIRQQIGQMV